MIHKLFDWLFGGGSRRFQMTLLYTIIFVGLSLAGKIDVGTFATFSGVFAVWITGDSIRK